MARGRATAGVRGLRAAARRVLACAAAAALLAQTALVAAGADLAAFDPGHRHVGGAAVGAHAHPGAGEAAAATTAHCDSGPAHAHAEPYAQGVGCDPGGDASASLAAPALGAPLTTLPAAGTWSALHAPGAAATVARVAALDPPPPRA